LKSVEGRYKNGRRRGRGGLKQLGKKVGKGLEDIRSKKVVIKWPAPIKKLFSPADIFTLMNFVCGISSVMLSMDGGSGFRLAMLLILFGVVFDGLDGPVARRFGPSRKFGVWLDSIADAMTFCIAPAMLLYEMFNQKDNDLLGILQTALVVCASLSIAVLGILRLARFSITHHRFKDFIGLPTPAMAMIVVGLCSVNFWSAPSRADWSIELMTSGRLLIVPALLLLISFAMVSDVLYLKIRGNLLLGIGTVLLIMMAGLIVGEKEPKLGLFASVVFVLSGFTYLASPMFKGPKNVWGASKRLKAEELRSNMDIVEMEQCVEGDPADEL
jgi:CDP-diacylglycerol--serine O-phosphatidyltransferase